MPLFPFAELRIYLSALQAGLRNVWVNGFKLGAVKTVGKIIQPINQYTRFPEYFYFGKKKFLVLNNFKKQIELKSYK